MYSGESDENFFDMQKPPVLMLDDFPSFEQLLSSKTYRIVDLMKDEVAPEFKKLPGIDKRPIANMVIYQLMIGKKVRGFLLLGRESIIKKYLRSELQNSEKLISAASEALEESEILKQAKLTVKQLERIFDLGNELTLDSSVDNILKKICTAIRRTLGWNVVIMDINNPYDDKYRMISILGIKDADYQSLIKNKKYPPFVDRIERSIPINNSHFYDHSRKSDSTDVQISGEWNDKDWVYVPISSRGKQLGMISLNDPVERRKPTSEKIRSIEYFANQAAVVIENTELFEQLKTSELRYRLLAETMTMGLVTCDMGGNILYVNNSLVRILNYEVKDELLEKSIYVLCSKSAKSKLEKHLMQTLSDKGKPEKEVEEVAGLEIELLDKKGEILPFMIYTSPFYQQDKRIGYFAVLSDLRNQKKIERMRADFNSMIVHDLRSPLNIIQGYVDIVRTGVVGDINEEQIELLTIAKDNVFKLLKLIDSFLTASKLEAGHLSIETETNSLNSLIETLFEQSQLLAKEKKLVLAIDLDENLPLLVFDKFRMEQVIRNYMSNAIKFTPLEGKITVASKLLKKKNEKTNDFDLFVQVTVEDTGVGISEKELDKVFNKYEQTEAGKDASLKGTGLGLAICREIIELHKGEVWVKSILHEGSTFGFTLPIESIDI
jgi:PAS domain S-box-containing protein